MVSIFCRKTCLFRTSNLHWPAHFWQFDGSFGWDQSVHHLSLLEAMLEVKFVRCRWRPQYWFLVDNVRTMSFLLCIDLGFVFSFSAHGMVKNTCLILKGVKRRHGFLIDVLDKTLFAFCCSVRAEPNRTIFLKSSVKIRKIAVGIIPISGDRRQLV